MAVELIASTSSYAKGSDLWAVAFEPQSTHILKMDWLSNFKISKYYSKKSPSLSDSQRQLAVDCDLDWVFPEEVTKKQNLLLHLPKHFPTKALLIVEAKTLRAWSLEIFDTWSKLSYPSLKIFLPKGLTMNKFLELWPRNIIENSHLYGIKIVEDKQ